jgi:regulator of protease activity HflC (stomatin/prohibitin superfamily)
MMVPVVAAAKKRKEEREAAAEASMPVKHNPVESSIEMRGGPRRFVNPVSAAAALIVWTIGIILSVMVGRTDDARAALVFLGSTVLAVLVLFAIKIANQWEKAVVLRFGKFRALRGPGLFFILPIVDQVTHLVDQRVRVTDVTAESALTRDTVPVDVDAIVFWTVWDAQKSVLEVSDYFFAIALSAQTALREAIGRAELAAMITEREHIGAELRKILDEKTNAWGITVHSVEIRDVKIPQGLEDAMSRQAQAERERQARIILGTAETEIAARFVAAGAEYENRPVALHLRAMNMLYEAIKEKGSMVIVPSSAVETMGLGGLSGMAALGGGPVVPKE